MIPILCVYDEPALPEGIRISLEKNREFSVDISLSAEDALLRLETTSYEAVISNYPIPGMDGLKFLKVLRTKYPSLPVILFTGKGGEEVAIEALNSGEELYLWKGGEPENQFAELKDKVRQLVMRRAAEKGRDESRGKYRGIVDNAPMGIFHATPEGRMINVNPAFGQIFGYDSPEDVVRTVNRQGGLTTLFVEPENWVDRVQQTSETGGWQSFKSGCRKKDGSVFAGMFTFRLYENPDVKPEIGGFVVEVTGSSRAQARIATSGLRYRSIFDLAGDAMVIIDRDTGAVLDANKAALSLYQYTPEEFRALTSASLVAEPDAGDSGIFTAREFCPVLYHRRKDGTRFPVEVTGSTEITENKTICVLSVRDITRRKGAEDRVLATSCLSVVLYRINEVIVRVHDLETLLFEICRIAVEYGHIRFAWIGLVDTEQAVIRPVAHAGFEDGFLTSIHIPLDASPEGSGPTGSAFRSGDPTIITDIATDTRRDSWREEALKRGYRSSAAFPFSLHGKVVGIINFYAAEPGLFTDEEAGLLTRIAEDVSFALGLLDEQARRARAEQALIGSDERARFLAAILETSSQPFFIGYEDGRFGVTNPAFCDLLGYTEAEIKNLSWKELTPPEFAASEGDELKELVVTGIPRRYEKEFLKKDTSRVPVEIFAHRATDSGGNLRYFSSFVTDVTAQKKVLREARQGRKEWETIFSAIGNPALILDPSRTIIEVNDALIRLTGKTRDELRTMKCWQVFHGPDSTGPAEGCPFERMKSSGTPETATREITAFKGTFLISCTPVKDEAGALERVILIATDITRLKRVEQTLSDSEARYRAIFENSTDAVILMNGTILDCNPAAEQLWGCTRGQIIGHDPVEFSPQVQPDGRESKEAAASYRLAARDGGNQFFLWQFRNNDGRLIDTDVSLSSIMVGGKRRLVAIIRDITARKHTEAQIGQSEQTLHLITDSFSDMVWLSDLDLIPVCINPVVIRLQGYTLEELQQLSLDRRFAPESCTQILALRDELIAAGDPEGRMVKEPVTLELEFCKKSGGTFWSETTFTLIRDTENIPVRVLAVGRDITERKQIENQVRRLASFPQLNPEPVIEINLNKEILYANPACQSLLQNLGMPGNPAAFLPADINEIIASLQASRSGIISREVPVGDAVFEESLTLSPGGLAVRVNAHDITARHQAASALTRANRKLHLLTGITRHDISNRLTAVLGYLELARSSTNDPTLQEFLLRSETAAVGIRHQIDFTKEYENIGSSAPAWQDVSSLVAAARAQLDLCGITLEDETAGVSIYADPMFSRIIVHLVDNALRHGGEHLTRIRFSGSVSPDGYVLVCEDDGAGIQKKDKAAIFRRVIREDTKVGLFLIQDVLSLTMIMIRETGEPGRGARFEMTVPPGAYRVAGVPGDKPGKSQ